MIRDLNRGEWAAIRRVAPALAGIVVVVCAGQTRSFAADPVGDLPAPQPATNLFENTLGMRFVPVPGLKARFSVWETRVGDYRAFIAATERAWTESGFSQGPDHPAVNVNWEDATAFCFWLTGKERKEGKLGPKQRYRLPSDREWTTATGVASERGATPEDRMKTQVLWPWGHYWPPQTGDGNYSPELRADSFPNTAPVATFKPNSLGLFDLGGNVWEWCEDWYNDAHVTKTLSGASFNDAQPGYLLATYRFSGTMNLASDDIGFRIVLEQME
jgi:formylglycine-generating enzyme required for sulfatase activity